MQKLVSTALLASVLGIGAATADPMLLQPERYNTTGSVQRTAPAYVAPQAPVQQQRRYASAEQGVMGGGFIEFLFGGGQPVAAPRPPGEVYAHAGHAMPDPVEVDPRRLPPDPKFLKQVVPYSGKEKPGTVVIDTSQRFLFLVQNDGTALRYGIGVGRDGFTWNGVKTVTAKKEWPDWRPPEEMLQRRPDLPGFMAGGPENPLGARAMYLGSSLYRIHGSNEPWTIGQAVSSGCFRLRNEDVIDLYDRVKVGARVVVM
jgi:lipoprotein-anchoring transpeptidase ErfK/SrfK